MRGKVITDDYVKFLLKKLHERNKDRELGAVQSYSSDDMNETRIWDNDADSKRTWHGFCTVCSCFKKSLESSLSHEKITDACIFSAVDLGAYLDMREHMDIRLANMALASCYVLFIPRFYQQTITQKLVMKMISLKDISENFHHAHLLLIVHGYPTQDDDVFCHAIRNPFIF